MSAFTDYTDLKFNEYTFIPASDSLSGWFTFAPPPTAIDKLREQRKPTTTSKPKKPKPVTDEQLLAIVEELHATNKQLRADLDDARKRLNQFRLAGFWSRVFGRGWWHLAKKEAA